MTLQRSVTVITLLAVTVLFISRAAAEGTTPSSSSFDTTAAIRALHYSKACNCGAEQLANWTCGPSCEFNAAATDVHVVENATAGTRALILFNPMANEFVVDVRGSRNAENWIEDFDLVHVPYVVEGCGLNQSCAVHQGFLYALHSLVDAGLMEAVQDAFLSPAVPEGADLLVAGHSLGGAVATLLAPLVLELLSLTSKPFGRLHLVTFGSPRVGNEAFTAYVADALTGTGHIQTRLTHSRDPVPHLPFQAWGYDHVPSEVFFPHNTSTGFKLCNDGIGFEDKTCSDGLLAINPYDHIWYLGICTGCCDPAEGSNCCRHLPIVATQAAQRIADRARTTV